MKKALYTVFDQILVETNNKQFPLDPQSPLKIYLATFTAFSSQK